MKAHFTPGNATFYLNGKTKLISSDNPKYNEAKELYKVGDLEGLEELVFSDETVVTNTYGGRVQIDDGVATIDGETLPLQLSARIVEYAKENMPFDYLVNFWNRLKANPSFNSRQSLFDMLERNFHPILPDGRFLAWKSVRSDFTDWHTGKFSNVPGAILEIPRKDVDDNINNDCSYGFHVGSMQYVNEFHNTDSRRIIEVAVDPADAVAVPTDCDRQKLRTCKYEVLAEVERVQVIQDSYSSYISQDDYDNYYDDEDEDDSDDDYDSDDTNW